MKMELIDSLLLTYLDIYSMYRLPHKT